MARSLAVRKNQLPKVTTPVKNCDLILADVSGSMLSTAQNGQSKLDCLRTALAAQRGIALVAFSNRVTECGSADDILGLSHGGTNLNLALSHALTLEPMHVLVVSDGEPSAPDACLAKAQLLAADCIIDALFIGRDSDIRGIAFMQSLAEIGRGRFMKYDLEHADPKLLGQRIAGLLAGPSEETIEL